MDRNSQSQRYDGPTYYGLAALKPSKYRALVWTYTWLSGLAGGAQVLAGVARLLSRRQPELGSVVRQGRVLALAGAAAGPVLLIADLRTPQRWYNMLRIFRRTSPMSIGTYLLSSFGPLSLATTLGGARRRGLLGRTADAAQLPASVAGAGLGTYTAALLSSTSTPLWSAAPRLLSARFACSALSSAAAALSLGQRLAGHEANARRLDRIAMASTAAELLVGQLQQDQYSRLAVDGPLHEGLRAQQEHQASRVLGHALPLVLYGVSQLGGRRAPGLPALAALGVLAGGLLMRSSVFRAGNRSAARPQDYFGLTQARSAATQALNQGQPERSRREAEDFAQAALGANAGNQGERFNPGWRPQPVPTQPAPGRGHV